MSLNYNNPGNIKITSDRWIGAVYPGDSSTFVTFSSLPYGYRALYRLLRGYIESGYNTISRIIYRYAPPGDNNPTVNYVNYIQSATGIDKDTTISKTDYQAIFQIGYAISRFETGTNPNEKDAQAGFQMAFNPWKYGEEGKTNFMIPLTLSFALLMLMSK